MGDGPSQLVHPYDGVRAVLTTMHGKGVAIAPTLRTRLGLIVEVAQGIDTDQNVIIASGYSRYRRTKQPLPGLDRKRTARQIASIVASRPSVGLASLRDRLTMEITELAAHLRARDGDSPKGKVAKELVDHIIVVLSENHIRTY